MNPLLLPDNAGGEAYWVKTEQVQGLHRMDVQTRSALDDLYGQFLSVVLRNITEFFGIQEAKRLLDDMEKISRTAQGKLPSCFGAAYL